MWHGLRFFSLRTILHGSPELFWTLLVERSWCDRLEKIAQSSVRVSISITPRTNWLNRPATQRARRQRSRLRSLGDRQAQSRRNQSLRDTTALRESLPPPN